MLVDEVQSRSRSWERKHGGEQGNPGPMSALLGKELEGDAPGGPENSAERKKLSQQLSPGEGNTGEADEVGHQGDEEGGLGLQAKEVGIVREESRIEAGFDRGEIDAVVFETGVVSHDGESDQGEQKDEKKRQ